jgi:hypothetical protein
MSGCGKGQEQSRLGSAHLPCLYAQAGLQMISRNVPASYASRSIAHGRPRLRDRAGPTGSAPSRWSRMLWLWMWRSSPGWGLTAGATSHQPMRLPTLPGHRFELQIEADLTCAQ